MPAHHLDSPIHQLARAHLKTEHGGFFPEGDPRMWCEHATRAGGALDHVEGEEPVAFFADRAKAGGMFFEGTLLGSRTLVDVDGDSFDLTKLVTFSGQEEKKGGGSFTFWDDKRAYKLRLAAGKGWMDFFGRLTELAPEDREGSYREPAGTPEELAEELAFEDERIDVLVRFVEACERDGRLDADAARVARRKIAVLNRTWMYGRGASEGGLVTVADADLPYVLMEQWGRPDKIVDVEGGVVLGWGEVPSLAAEVAKTVATDLAGAAVGALTGVGFKRRQGLKYWTAEVRFHGGAASVKLEGAKPLSGVLPLRKLDDELWKDAYKAIVARELRLFLLRGLQPRAKYPDLVKLKDSDIHTMAKHELSGFDLSAVIGYSPTWPTAWTRRAGVRIEVPAADLPEGIFQPLPKGWRPPPTPAEAAQAAARAAAAPPPEAAPASAPASGGAPASAPTASAAVVAPAPRPAAAPPSPEQVEADGHARKAGMVQLAMGFLDGAVTWWALPALFTAVGLPALGFGPCIAAGLAPLEFFCGLALVLGGAKWAGAGRFVAVLQMLTLLLLNPLAAGAGFVAFRLLGKAKAAQQGAQQAA